MTSSYFCMGTSLASLANVETLVTDDPTVLQPGNRALLLGQVERRTHAGRMRRDGRIDHAWAWDSMTEADKNTWVYNTRLAFTTAARQLYITTIDERQLWTPFLAWCEPVTYADVNTTWVRDVVQPWTGLQLQSATKTTAYTATASDRFLYVDCTAGTVAITLPAGSAVNANTPFTFVKTTSAGVLEVVHNGGTVTVTTQYAHASLVSNGATVWTSI